MNFSPAGRSKRGAACESGSRALFVSTGYARGVNETQVELNKIRCPRCAGELVLRIVAEEEAGAVRLVLDTACISCGVAPWADSDQRLLVFRPGAPIGAALSGAASDYAAEMAAAQARVDALLRRCDELEREVQSARQNVTRVSTVEQRRKGELEQELRGEISRLEGSLADARAEVRRADEATRGSFAPGIRPIELD